jgi:hypothetical protein
MQTKFYTSPNNPLWDDMRHKICTNILKYICGESTPKYRIHFDKMIYNTGWFLGFVEIWKGVKPYNRRVRRIPFTVHVTDWEGWGDCQIWENYRVINKG